MKNIHQSVKSNRTNILIDIENEFWKPISVKAFFPLNDGLDHMEDVLADINNAVSNRIKQYE